MAPTPLAHWQIHDGTGHRKYLTEDEVARFLRVARWRAPSVQAFCFLLAYTGCRISEGLALARNHCDQDRMTVLLRTLKRRRTVYRAVPVPPIVIQQLMALPLRANGLFWDIDRTTAWRHIKEVMTLAGIIGPMATPKGLRHGFGIRAAIHGVPPNLIQRWLGHASLKTTAIYLDAVGSEEHAFARRTWDIAAPLPCDP